MSCAKTRIPPVRLNGLISHPSIKSQFLLLHEKFMDWSNLMSFSFTMNRSKLLTLICYQCFICSTHSAVESWHRKRQNTHISSSSQRKDGGRWWAISLILVTISWLISTLIGFLLCTNLSSRLMLEVLIPCYRCDLISLLIKIF